MDWFNNSGTLMGGWEAQLPCGDQILVTLNIDESGDWVVGRHRWEDGECSFVAVSGFKTDDEAKAFASELRIPVNEESYFATLNEYKASTPTT